LTKKLNVIRVKEWWIYRQQQMNSFALNAKSASVHIIKCKLDQRMNQ